MYLIRILMLASLIGVSYGFFFMGHWNSDDAGLDKCINECKNEPMILIGVFMAPNNLGCSWHRRRRMGMTTDQIQQFCYSCPDPAACYPNPYGS